MVGPEMFCQIALRMMSRGNGYVKNALNCIWPLNGVTIRQIFWPLIVVAVNGVGMDSSLSARKALAADLKYSGDTNDSATMNMWLHKEVMKKLAANGGRVPADLLSR